MDDTRIEEMYALLRDYWQFKHSTMCQPWFPHDPDDPDDDEECKAPEPDILKHGPDAPYSY